eukprot:4921462-Pleurochrysis_carterae.AAC.1
MQPNASPAFFQRLLLQWQRFPSRESSWLLTLAVCCFGAQPFPAPSSFFAPDLNVARVALARTERGEGRGERSSQVRAKSRAQAAHALYS